MRRTIRTAFLSLLCAGALALVTAADSDNWAVLDEDASWSNVFYNAPYQPLDSLEPISVVMTGKKDADGYPIGDIYYNEGPRCKDLWHESYRYYPTMVSGVRGLGYGESTNLVNPVWLYTHPIYNKKTKGYDYGWINSGDGMHYVSLAGWLDESKTTFSEKCGRYKIGTFKDVLKIAKDKSYYRARLAIDRQLWSTEFLTGDAVNDKGFPIWTAYFDSIRLGRAYYYLYLSEPMKHFGYSCSGDKCPTTEGTYYYDQNHTSYDIIYKLGIPFYAPVTLQVQHRRWILNPNGKYEPSDWKNDESTGCLDYEYQREWGDLSPGFLSCGRDYETNHAVNLKRVQRIAEGDSMVEYRLAGITRIAEGPSRNGAHAMQILDTTYSDIIKLVPKYKVHVDNGNYGGGYFYGERNCGGEEVAGTKCSYRVIGTTGYDFKCWSSKEDGSNCVSTANPVTITVRHDTTLYAIYVDSPFEVSMRADSSTEVRYNNQYKVYSHVLGRDSLYFYGYVSGPKKDGYFACEYNDGTNGWQRFGSVKKVPADDLVDIRHVALRINKTGEARCVYNGVDTLGTKKFSKATETKFRFALSYNSDFSAVVYSETKTVRWLHPIAFYDLDKKLISDTVQLYGTTVNFPTDRALINVPADANGIHYDYYWTDQNTTKYVSGTKSIKLEKDSLRVRSWLIEKYEVKFVDFDGTVLKDTVVAPGGSSVAPSVPNHEGFRFKGWNFKNASWSDRYNEVYNIEKPETVTALYDTLYTVRFVDRVGYSVLKSEELVYGVSPTEAPDVPSHKGLAFEDWDIDWTKITRPSEDTSHLVMVNTVYDIPQKAKLAFTVTDFDFGSKAEDIKVGVPNECFEVSKEIYKDGNKSKKVDSVEEWENHHVELTVSVTCADDSLGNIWKYLPYGSEREGKMFVTLNGENVAVSANSVLYYYIFPVTFADYDGTVLKQEFVPLGKSATAPKDPVRKGYVFDGWDADYSEIESSVTVTAQYKKEASSSSSAKSSSSSAKAKSSSSSAKAKSSSSSAKAKSSSSSAKAKSSSSKAKSSSSKGKDAIVAAAQVPQFSLAAVGREIQVVGARVGSAYAVLDMQGRVIAKGRVNATDFSVRMDRSATYLMRIGNQTQAVKIK